MELLTLIVFIVINCIFLFTYKDYLENKYKSKLLIIIKKDLDIQFKVVNSIKRRPSILLFYPCDWSNNKLKLQQFKYYDTIKEAEKKLFHMLKVDDYAKNIVYPKKQI